MLFIYIHVYIYMFFIYISYGSKPEKVLGSKGFKQGSPQPPPAKWFPHLPSVAGAGLTTTNIYGQYLCSCKCLMSNGEYLGSLRQDKYIKYIYNI